jgi:hypothetical protein
MNYFPTSLRRRSRLDVLGLFALVLLIVMNAFHFNLYNNKTYLFYREVFSLLFISLLLYRFLSSSWNVLDAKLRLSNPILHLLLFPILLFFWSFFDPHIPLYGAFDVEGVSTNIGGASPTVYILRNALLYLPMVVYFHLRGLSLSEILIVLLAIILVAPISIFYYLRSGELNLTIREVVSLGGAGIAYNSYVPYLTFSILSGFYLLFAKTSLFVKITVLPCLLQVIMFCLFSTSRQSVVFIIIIFAVFMFVTKERSARSKKWVLGTMTVVLGIVFFIYLTQGNTVSDKFLDRFATAGSLVSDETGRLDVALHGISILKPLNWIVGAGLTSVVNSGPHNDYIRWTQRVGFPLMILGFVPFLMAFIRSTRLMFNRHLDNRLLFAFLSLAVGFTLFHSLFGYPREDSNQAVAVYLGLTLWFGAYREGLLPFVEMSQVILLQRKGNSIRHLRKRMKL